MKHAVKIFARIWVVLLLFSASVVVQAQDQATQQVIYRSWVHYENAARPYIGVLLSTTDSTILVLPNAKSYTLPLATGQALTSIPVTAIEDIRFRKRGSPGRGAVLGALTGLITGMIIGFASGDDEGTFLAFTAEEKAVVTGTLLLLPGAGLGAILGSRKKKIYNQGDRTAFRNARRSLNEYALQPAALYK